MTVATFLVRILGLARVLLDRTFGVMTGQKCDLCREWTTRRLSGEYGTVTWCLVCLMSELVRHGL